MIVIYSTNRTWRAALDRALHDHGVQTRMASRQAELAKSLVQAGMAFVMAGPDEASRQQAQHTIAAIAPQLLHVNRWYAATPDDTMDDLVRRAQVALAP